MSFDAIRWAMDQQLKPAARKFALVAMADCVNAEAGTWEFFASYNHLARRTGMNTKTVEASVYELRQLGYIIDTGRRAGDTGKVIVYRLNDPAIGGVPAKTVKPDANGTRPLNTTETGAIPIPPNLAVNPPKNTGQSPQILEVTTPKTGDVSSKGTRKKSGKEPDDGTAFAALINVHQVNPELLNDWLKVRKAKRAGPLTETVISGLVRECATAGLTVADAVRLCCERGWQGFRAEFVQNAQRPGPGHQTARASRTAQVMAAAAAHFTPPDNLEDDHGPLRIEG